MTQAAKDPLITIGQLATRTGLEVSAIRYYADKGLIPVFRSRGGNRVFRRSVIRRIAFIQIAQQLDYSLARIQSLLDTLPDQRSPTKRDWARFSRIFTNDLDNRIKNLEILRDNVTNCIGCGCLSLKSCKIYNREDQAQALGSGPGLLAEKMVSDQL